MRLTDIRLLGGLVTPAQEQIDDGAFSYVVNTVARPEIDPHLIDALTHGRAIAEVSRLGRVDTRSNSNLALQIPQAVEPLGEDRCLLKDVHGSHCIQLDTIDQNFSDQQVPGPTEQGRGDAEVAP